ncbi:MAG: hypothetical protein N3B18_13495 [Desulfobacterota bacterium]|nr:hypothetical protein [Thermodesulfobacteriota bacterium]
MKKIYMLGVLVICCIPYQVIAGDNATRETIRPAERFGRGMINILSSPLELPAQMYTRAEYYSNTREYMMATIGGFIEGIPMGMLVYFPWRLAAGVYDVFTFPFPACNRCIIDPPYLSFSTKFLEKP